MSHSQEFSNPMIVSIEKLKQEYRYLIQDRWAKERDDENRRGFVGRVD